MNTHLLAIYVVAVFVAMIAAGLAALFAAAPTAFLIVRLCGAAYLLYLGGQALRSARRGSPIAAAGGQGPVAGSYAYRLLVDGTVGLMAGRIGGWLSSRRRARQVLDAGAGTIMVGLAARLAAER